METFTLKSENLENEDFRIECEIRTITGPIKFQFFALDARLKEESNNGQLIPRKPHVYAIRFPNSELSLCSLKLQQTRTKLVNLIKDNPDAGDEIEIIASQLIHVMGRMERLATLEEVRSSSLTYLNICRDLLVLCGNYKDKSQGVETSLMELSVIHIEQFASEISQQRPQGPEQVTENKSPDKSSTSKLDSPISVASLANYQTAPGVTFGPFPPHSTFYNPVLQPQLLQNLHSGIPPRGFMGENVIPQYSRVNTVVQPGIHTQFPEKSTISQSIPQPLVRLPLHTPVYKWNVKFDGLPTGMAVENFFLRVEHLANTHGVSLEQLQHDVTFLLSGPAQEHYWLTVQQIPRCTWINLRNSFIHRFQDRRTDVDIRKLIDDRKQRPNESFVDFYYSILAMSMPMKMPFSENELLEILKKNMRVGLITHLAGRPIFTVSELVSVCISTEDIWKRIGHMPENILRIRSPDIHEVSVTPRETALQNYENSQLNSDKLILTQEHSVLPYYDQNRQLCYNTNNVDAIGYRPPTAYNPQIAPPNTRFCFNCRQQGHTWFKCDLPSNTFCYVCGTPDVKMVHCIKCSRKPENRALEMNKPGPSHFRNPSLGPQAICQRPPTIPGKANTSNQTQQ